MVSRWSDYINGKDEVINGKIVHHKSLAERIAEEEKKYKEGLYTDKKWTAYCLAQIGRGEKFRATSEALAERMSNTNKVAAAYVNDKTPSIYSLNANYQAYEIGKGLEGVSFTMYDEQTVKNMITEDGNYTEFRTLHVDPKRDYLWNTKQIQSVVTSGILQGKGIKDLTDSFMTVMQRNRNAAIRNARTAYTSAQNGGRMASLRQAKAQGINVRKQWLSAHDNRVRDTHAVLNDQIRDIEEKFDNGLLYPADSSGAPAEVYNCRCTLTYIYPDGDTDESAEIYRSNALEGETFQEFVKRMKREENNRQLWSVNQSSIWAGTKGTEITKEIRTELMQYAKDKGVRLSNLRKFDGDPELLKSGIDRLSELQERYGYRDYVLDICGFADDGDFGSTTRKSIHINNLALRDRTTTEEILSDISDLRAETVEDIFDHEYGHIIDYNNKADYLEIAKWAYYNLYGEKISTSELNDYLERNISKYSITTDKFGRFFEITSELNVAQKYGNSFAREYMKIR